MEERLDFLSSKVCQVRLPMNIKSVFIQLEVYKLPISVVSHIAYTHSANSLTHIEYLGKIVGHKMLKITLLQVFREQNPGWVGQLQLYFLSYAIKASRMNS